MQAGRDVLGALGCLDAWAQQFPRREVPGYARTAVLCVQGDLPAEEVSRRIDRVSVTPSLLHYGTSMFTMPVGFNNHQAVVLQFVGLGVSGTSLTTGNSLLILCMILLLLNG